MTFLLHQLLPKATVVAQAQSEYNSENINEQILTVNTLYPQIDPNVLKASDASPCEHKKLNNRYPPRIHRQKLIFKKFI